MPQKWKAEFHLLLQQLKQNLQQLDTNEDSKAEVEALTAISQLGYEQGKLAEIKSQHAMQETAANEQPTLQPQQSATSTCKRS
jgi:Holliday junction resolvasome RuvABC DNA-binding subunit